MTSPSPSQLDVSPRKRSPLRNLSFVWAVPLLALVISLGIAWQNYSNRGVLIDITFLNASGISPGETTIRYRDVVIGTVENITFAPDLTRVVVAARIDKEIAQYLDKDAQFWVVRPKVTARGISGLSTVLSGVYIEGAWNTDSGEQLYSFIGSEEPPLVQPGRPGTRITLVTNDGRLIAEGAPVFFHGVEVGRLEKPRLTLSSDAIVVDAFIEAPHDRRLNSATRFWDISGFSVSFGGKGLTLDFDSIASVLAGGVEFDALYEGGDPVSPGHVYNLYSNQADARKSLVARSTAGSVDIAAKFGESVAGLEPGAPVLFGGLPVGDVKSIAAQVSQVEGGPELGLVAVLSIDPVRLGLGRGATSDEVLDFFEKSVADGLRAQLTTASLFDSSLVVQLVNLPDAEPASLQRDADPAPMIPTERSNIPDFTATAEGILDRVNRLPIEQLFSQTIALMNSLEQLASSDSTQAVPGAVVGLLDDARSIVNDDATKALPGDIRDAVAELRGVVAELKSAGAIDGLTEAIANANKAVANIATASEQFPALVEELRGVAAKVNSLKTDELVTAATQILESADAVLATPAAKELPPTLNAALDQIRATLADLREGGAVENLNTTMASARDAADAVAAATERLPELAGKLDRLVTQAEGLVAAYGTRSDFSTETLATIREVRDAARSVSQLARTIERNPNSLLIGR